MRNSIVRNSRVIHSGIRSEDEAPRRRMLYRCLDCGEKFHGELLQAGWTLRHGLYVCKDCNLKILKTEVLNNE